MRFLTKDEADDWWRLRFGALDPTLWDTPPLRVPSFEDTPIRQLFPCCRAVVDWLAVGGTGELMVCALETGIWMQNNHLIDTWRADRGATSPLEATPAHLFALDEFAYAVDLMCIALPWGWGITVAGARRAINLDHDGHIRIHAETAIAAAQASRIFQA